MNANEKNRRAYAFLFTLMSVSVLAVYLNTFFENPTVWYLVDMLYVFVPLTFTAFCMRSMERGVTLAVLLWVPGAGVLYMLSQGLLATPHALWSVINMYQLVVYSYILGMYLRIPLCSGKKSNKN